MCVKHSNDDYICLTCEHLIPIGEGDHICDADDEPRLILDDYEPTDDYFWCGSSEYEEGGM